MLLANTSGLFDAVHILQGLSTYVFFLSQKETIAEFDNREDCKFSWKVAMKLTCIKTLDGFR